MCIVQGVPDVSLKTNRTPRLAHKMISFTELPVKDGPRVADPRPHRIVLTIRDYSVGLGPGLHGLQSRSFAVHPQQVSHVRFIVDKKHNWELRFHDRSPRIQFTFFTHHNSITE